MRTGVKSIRVVRSQQCDPEAWTPARPRKRQLVEQRLASLHHVPDVSLPEACAAARAVLETPLSEVIRAVTGLPSPKKHTRAQARFVGGTRGREQNMVSLNHDSTLSDALREARAHRILGAPVLIQPDPLHADEMNHGAHHDDSGGRERPVLLGFFDVGDALRALVKALPEDDKKEDEAVEGVEEVPPSAPGSRLPSRRSRRDTGTYFPGCACLIAWNARSPTRASSRSSRFGRTTASRAPPRRHLRRVGRYRIVSMSDAVRYLAVKARSDASKMATIREEPLADRALNKASAEAAPSTASPSSTRRAISRASSA